MGNKGVQNLTGCPSWFRFDGQNHEMAKNWASGPQSHYQTQFAAFLRSLSPRVCFKFANYSSNHSHVTHHIPACRFSVGFPNQSLLYSRNGQKVGLRPSKPISDSVWGLFANAVSQVMLWICLLLFKSLAWSTIISATAASRSFFPANPVLAARNLEMANDWAKLMSPYSSSGRLPNGVPAIVKKMTKGKTLVEYLPKLGVFNIFFFHRGKFWQKAKIFLPFFISGHSEYSIRTSSNSIFPAAIIKRANSPLPKTKTNGIISIFCIHFCRLVLLKPDLVLYIRFMLTDLCHWNMSTWFWVTFRFLLSTTQSTNWYRAFWTSGFQEKRIVKIFWVF